MVSFAAPSLMLVVLVPLGGSLLLAPFLRAPWPWLRLVFGLGAHLGALGVAASLSRELLARGGWTANGDSWVGARAEAVDALGLVPMVLTGSTALLLLALLAAALVAAVALVPHALQARSTALHTGLLLATGAIALLVVAQRADALAAAFSLSGLCGFGMLASALPKRDEGTGAVRAFVLHRVGDVALFAAIVAVGGALGGLDAEPLLKAAQGSPWDRFTEGPLMGFAPREAWLLVGGLVLVAAASRLALFPLQALVRDAVGLPGPALGFAYGACFLGVGVVLLVRLSPVLWLSPEVLTALGALAVATLLSTAALALAGRDLVRIDVMLLSAFAALAALAVAAADSASAVLGVVTLLCAAVPLCATTGALVAATGRTDPHLLGGLEPRMPRTHTARLLATGALFGPLFAGATLNAHLLADLLAAPWLGATFVAGLLLGIALLALAAFRPLHLVFTGKDSREPLAKPAADPPWRVSIPHIAAALPVLGFGLAHLPSGVIRLVFPERSYASPVSLWTTRELAALLPVRELVLPTATTPDLSPSAALLLVVGCALAGWLASTLLYRGGPSRLHKAIFGGARAQRTVEVLSRFAGRESQVARGVGEGAERLSRMIAANLAPGLLEALLRRIPAFAATIVGAAVRLLANGSAQRGLTVAILGLVALVAVWTGLWEAER